MQQQDGKSTDALLITDASTQVFHQLCKINSESPKSNDLTQRMLPYANVHKLVKLWILKDMMQSDASTSSSESSEDATLMENRRHLPHEIQFEIIKYIPTHSTFDNNRDEWWVTYFKHRLISSSIKEHAEREIMTRWNREGLNLSRFLYSTNDTIEYPKYRILSKLLKDHQLYNGDHQPTTSSTEEEIVVDEKVAEENDEIEDNYQQDGEDSKVEESPHCGIPSSDTNTTTEHNDDIMMEEEQSDRSDMTREKQVMMDEIMQELNGKAVKNFTFEKNGSNKTGNQSLWFYTSNQTNQIEYEQYYSLKGGSPVEFTNNYHIKQLILPIIDEANDMTIQLVASLKALETLHIIYYGRGVSYLMQQFDQCHAKTVKLTIPSTSPFQDAIRSLSIRYRFDEEYHSKVSFKHFPNLVTYHIEGIEPDSFTLDYMERTLPCMEFYMANNQHMASYSSDTNVGRILQVHLSEFHAAISDWNRLIQSSIYVNPFYEHCRRESLMEKAILSTDLSLNEKKQFIMEVMRHPGHGLMSCQVRGDIATPPLERTCLMQWSIYCLNKYNTYKLLDTCVPLDLLEKKEDTTLRDYKIAQYLLYGWNPEYNLLETLTRLSSHKLTQPLMKMLEQKLQSNPDAFSLKYVQHVLCILLRKRNRFSGVKLIELVRKYHVDGCDLFKPEDARSGRGLLHLIFSMDLPLVAMEKILQCVTPDDLLYVTDVERDKATVLTLGLYSHELTNEFLLKMIEKQPMLAHLPIYNESTTINPIDDDPFQTDEVRGNRSLLHCVVGDMKRWELIPILVEKYGCDVKVQDLSGRTPRDVALMLLDDLQWPLDFLPPCLQ